MLGTLRVNGTRDAGERYTEAGGASLSLKTRRSFFVCVRVKGSSWMSDCVKMFLFFEPEFKIGTTLAIALGEN